MLKIYDFITNNLLATYDSVDMKYIEHELEVNNYTWCILRSINNDIKIIVTKNK